MRPCISGFVIYNLCVVVSTVMRPSPLPLPPRISVLLSPHYQRNRLLRRLGCSISVLLSLHYQWKRLLRRLGTSGLLATNYRICTAVNLVNFRKRVYFLSPVKMCQQTVIWPPTKKYLPLTSESARASGPCRFGLCCLLL